ncbi:ANTAR domain-containing protein [Lentzea waywayandensis]|uniref:ANTAR domain-containing protein n=1 Tax=Lentzea waywayandensis TaxID=84724 RepID=A0A1I6FF39_9PSEU|nr:ANTAR domain-containing protein [Lentzea waywayandensis]SFR28575.1 ANTAR domain-containing protein [Lentzea waywayandensis]
MNQVKFGAELISRVMDHLCSQLDGCEGVGLSVWPDGKLLKALGVAVELDAEQLTSGAGPLVEASRDERQVSGKVGGMDVVAVPGSWGDSGPVVLTVYLSHSPQVADLKAIEEIEPLIATAAAVVEFCAGEVMRADQMVRMVQHRRYIEQAKGLVMGARPSAPGEAFELLVRASQHANVKLRDVATALVLVVGGTLEDSAEEVVEPPAAAFDVARRLWEALRV